MDGRGSVWYAVSWNRDSQKLDKINSGGRLSDKSMAVTCGKSDHLDKIGRSSVGYDQ
jgi:hypothetical protein